MKHKDARVKSQEHEEKGSVEYDLQRKWKIWLQTVLRSVRMLEEGNRLAKLYGAENVFDFSLGNPNVPAPAAVKKAIPRDSGRGRPDRTSRIYEQQCRI